MLAFAIGKKPFLFLLAAWGFGHMAAAQDADDYRGGWRTDKGEAHTYEFSIRGEHRQGHLLHVLRGCDHAGVCRRQVRSQWHSPS